LAITPVIDTPEQMVLPLTSPPGLSEVFQTVFRRLRIKTPVATIGAEFHPFPGLRSTISLRHGVITARISDVLAEASPLVLEALAEILLARLFRRRPSREARECYLAYTFRPGVRTRADTTQRERGSKRLLPARGICYDLEEIFHRLNRRFFDDRLPLPRLGWSYQRARTLLGHYDSGHATIIISRLLDSPKAPLYLVEYVVYHEMLHIQFPTERHGHRRVMHSREFRAAEKKFPQYELACKQLKRFCARRSDL
jgi:hypothetical protein